MNTPSFKTLFFPYTLNTYLRQYKNNLTTLPIPNYSKFGVYRVLNSVFGVQSSEFKNGFRGPGSKVQGFRVQGSDVRLSVVPNSEH